ncbi:DUF418 domain-containing protein [Priestia sp. OVL9]|nr:DUF418 domain-containing protein [Priestia sp. OVL9]
MDGSSLWFIRNSYLNRKHDYLSHYIYTPAFFNKWWLYYFYYGPCEWLWRSFTYRSFPPLRRNRKASA